MIFDTTREATTQALERFATDLRDRPRRKDIGLIRLTALLSACGLSALYGQSPGIGLPPSVPALEQTIFSPRLQALAATSWYDTSDRSAIRDSWNLTFAPTAFVPMDWTGNVDANIAGTTSQAFKDAVAVRINWYRAMAG